MDNPNTASFSREIKLEQQVYDLQQDRDAYRRINAALKAAFDAMREALEAVAEEWERLECPLDHLGPQAPDWIRRVKTALALAKGERAE